MKNQEMITSETLVNKEFITQGVMNWNSYRTDADSMKTIFKLGGKFSFQISNEMKEGSSHIHAYACVSADKGSFYFILVPSKEDSPSNYHNLPATSANYIYAEVGAGTLPDHISGLISRNTAVDRTKRWSKLTDREDWIDANTTNAGNTGITEKGVFQAFVIPVSDLSVDIEHNCFLALKEDQSELTGTYAADLIIDNAQGGLHCYDMVCSIPPFGQHAYTVEHKFGILHAIGIN